MSTIKSTRPQTNEEYTYAFVRLDMPHPYPTVHLGHVMDAAGAQFGHKPGRNLVVLTSTGVKDLLEIRNLIEDAGIKTVMYADSDIGEITALATEPVSGLRRAAFRGFSLYK